MHVLDGGNEETSVDLDLRSGKDFFVSYLLIAMYYLVVVNMYKVIIKILQVRPSAFTQMIRRACDTALSP